MFDITQITGAVITIAVAIVTGLLIPYIRRKTTAAQQELISFWAQMGVDAAQQFLGSAEGSVKFEYVKEFLLSKGLTPDENELKIFIEQAVRVASLDAQGDALDAHNALVVDVQNFVDQQERRPVGQTAFDGVDVVDGLHGRVVPERGFDTLFAHLFAHRLHRFGVCKVAGTRSHDFTRDANPHQREIAEHVEELVTSGLVGEVRFDVVEITLADFYAGFVEQRAQTVELSVYEGLFDHHDCVVQIASLDEVARQ